jgi:hypothetical protein
MPPTPPTTETPAVAAPTPAKTVKAKKKAKGSLKKSFTFPIAPRRQFRALMIVVFLLFIGVVSFHMYFFYKINSPAIFIPDTQAATGPSVNEGRLTSVLSRYQAKQALLLTTSTLAPAVAEPSQ